MNANKKGPGYLSSPRAQLYCHVPGAGTPSETKALHLLRMAHALVGVDEYDSGQPVGTVVGSRSGRACVWAGGGGARLLQGNSAHRHQLKKLV